MRRSPAAGLLTEATAFLVSRRATREISSFRTFAMLGMGFLSGEHLDSRLLLRRNWGRTGPLTEEGGRVLPGLCVPVDMSSEPTKHADESMDVSWLRPCCFLRNQDAPIERILSFVMRERRASFRHPCRTLH